MLPADVGAALESINMDPEAIRAILAMLEQGAEGARAASEIDKPPAGQFGGSDAGAALAENCALAHEKFKTALQDMVKGLQGYHENIVVYRDQQLGTDEAVGAALNRGATNAAILNGIQKSEDCLTTPNVAAPSVCEVPTDGAGS